MNMKLFQQELDIIEENYPLSVPTSITLTVQIVMGVTLIGTVLVITWQDCKRKKSLSTLFKVAPEIKDLVNSETGGLVNSLKALLSHTSKQPTNEEAPKPEAMTSGQVTTVATTPSSAHTRPILPPHNQLPPLHMLTPPSEFLNPDVAQKLFQVYQRLPARDSHHYKKYLQWQSPIPTDAHNESGMSSYSDS